MIHNTQSAHRSKMEDGHNIYVTMKTMCPPSYHHIGFGEYIYIYIILWEEGDAK